jgi:C1A family cysteine protease
MLKIVRATVLALVLAALVAIGVAAPCPAQPALQPAQPSAVTAGTPSGPAAAGLGRLPNPVQMRLGTASGARLALRALALPAQFDLRAEGRLTPVKNQGQYGTCWAFANMGALESSLLPTETRDFSEANLVQRSGFGPFPDVTGHTVNLYQSGGYDAMAVAYFVRWAGPVDESDYPYPPKKFPRISVTRKHVQDVIMLPGRAGVHDNDLLKQMVVDNGALSVGMYADTAFINDGGTTFKSSTAAYYRPGKNGENHGVCIVGWDDTYSASNFTAANTPPGDGAFIVRNSWGTGWGDGGYFYASYYNRDFAFGDCTSYARVDDLGAYQRRYQYDTLGLVQARAFSGVKDPSTASIANRFTARADGHLLAVGFYATSGNCTYKVFAGPSLRSLTKLTSGTLALPGYHTVDLPSTMSLQQGHRFVVAVRLTTPGTNPMPMELPWGGPSPGYSSRASASPGQSFIRPASGRWWDLTGYAGLKEANVCLKAYTAK